MRPGGEMLMAVEWPFVSLQMVILPVPRKADPNARDRHALSAVISCVLPEPAETRRS